MGLAAAGHAKPMQSVPCRKDRKNSGRQRQNFVIESLYSRASIKQGDALHKREIYALIGVIGTVLSLGLILDAKSFATNLLASFVDIGIGVFVAFYLVDRITKRERRMKWARVRDITYDSVEAICHRIGDEIERELSICRPVVSQKPSPKEGPGEQRALHQFFFDYETEITRATEQLGKAEITVVVDESIKPASEAYDPGSPFVRAANQDIADQINDRMLNRASSRELYESVAPYTEQLFLHIYPRIIELDEDTELVRALIAIDSIYLQWSSTIELIEEWGAPEEFAWGDAASFCGCIGTMLKAIHAARLGADRSPSHYLPKLQSRN